MTDLNAALRALVTEIVREELARAQPPRTFLTVGEYARRYAISTSTVRAALRDGRLKFTRLGRAIRIREDAIVSATAVSPADAARIARLRRIVGGSVR